VFRRRVATGRPAAALVYRGQDSVQTLAAALDEFYDANPARLVLRPREPSSETRAMRLNSDICHVVFGLDTTPEDEALVDVRALFCSDVDWGRYARYRSDDKSTGEPLGKAGYGSVIAVTLRAAPRIARVFLQRLTARKRWPWNAPDRFMVRSLKHLRREFGIKVI
jgi:hypothetical protein